MVKLNDMEYSGIVTEGDDEISAVISTTDMLADIVGKMTNVKQVTYTDAKGNEKVYNVTHPLSASTVSRNIYAIRFSTKPTPTEELEAKSQEMSDAIDDLLVMMLEG